MARPEFFAATLTVQQVEDVVRYIGEIAADDEAAHGLEDDLRREVLTAIAIGRLTNVNAALAALACLETSRIEFQRWCA